VAGTAILGRLRRLPWLTATVREVVAETARVRTIVLEADGWSGHRAGQHIDVRLTAEDGYQAERAYSIASAPEEDRVRISVELVEEGEVSPYLAGELMAGDVFEIRGPVGGYFTWSADEPGPLLLVAGGVGLVPLMSMLRHRAVRSVPVKAHLLVSARSPDDVLYRGELETLEPREGLRVAHTYTREAPPGWTGWSGRVDAAMLADVSPGPDARCFVCGPTPFVEAVNDLLVAGGHHPRDVHAERFGPTGG
jgi:ferredoxin-NADP reductase